MRPDPRNARRFKRAVRILIHFIARQKKIKIRFPFWLKFVFFFYETFPFCATHEKLDKPNIFDFYRSKLNYKMVSLIVEFTVLSSQRILNTGEKKMNTALVWFSKLPFIFLNFHWILWSSSVKPARVRFPIPVFGLNGSALFSLSLLPPLFCVQCGDLLCN